MSYTCPDCDDGILEAKVREIPLELKDDETARIVGGVVLVTSVRCNNGCSPEDEEEEEDEKPKRKKKRTPPKAWVAAPGQQRCTRSDLCSRAYAHTGMCNKRRGEEEA